jgi:hypothetical protein
MKGRKEENKTTGETQEKKISTSYIEVKIITVRNAAGFKRFIQTTNVKLY